MSYRKPRPLIRNEQTLRDDRLFLIACDDQYAPKQYFAFFRLPRVQVHVVPTVDGSSAAGHVLDRLLEFEHESNDERWLILDVDHYAEGRHLGAFRGALSRARKLGVRVALSKPCFELWLLLHCEKEAAIIGLETCTLVTEELRKHLGSYDKAKLRSEHFPVGGVVRACKRARSVDCGKEIPTANGSQVYQLWEAIVARMLPSQLPPEMAEIGPAT